MVDGWTGDWEPKESYKDHPESKWCDLDYVADWIIRQNYKPKTSLKNLTETVLLYYEDNLNESGYFEVKDCREYPDSLMVNIPDVAAYVEASGGLQEFDYE